MFSLYLFGLVFSLLDLHPLVLKLDKGKVSTSCILERALLPPKAVQVALPAILNVLWTAPTKQPQDDAVDQRLFSILARVVQTIGQLSPQMLLESMYSSKMVWM